MACSGTALPFYFTLFHLHPGLQNGLFLRFSDLKFCLQKNGIAHQNLNLDAFSFTAGENILYSAGSVTCNFDLDLAINILAYLRVK
jgi:hypothetical protein